MEASAVFISLLMILLLSIYKYLTRNDNFFRRRGVEFEKPKIFFGNMLDVFLGRETEAALFEHLYDMFSREKLFGVFILQRPVLVIKNVELIKQIMITDFNNFTNYAENEFDSVFDGVFQKSLMFLEDRDWRVMRNVVDKIYAKTSVEKIHQNLMISAINSLTLIERESFNEKPLVIDTKVVFGRFIAESIGRAVLGDETSEKISEIHQIIKFLEIDLTSFGGSMKLLLNSLLPMLFKLKIFRVEVREFFKNNLTQEINRRLLENGKTDPKNLIQMFIEGSKESKLKADAIAEQFLIFFAGGFHSTLKLIQRCFYELAKNPKIQQELINEIDQVAASLQGESVKCETLNSMRFLEMVIYETLRKWPPIPFGSRICTKDCTITTDECEQFKFLKGDLIHLPFKLIQNDAKYFTKPELFFPSRFNSESSQHSFLAFGLGPRSCVGSHFILLQSKIFIFTILSKFSVKTVNESDVDSSDKNVFLGLALRK